MWIVYGLAYAAGAAATLGLGALIVGSAYFLLTRGRGPRA